VTLTSKLAAPAAVGVPLTTTVPAPTFGVTFASVSPVLPATKFWMVRVEYGVVPFETVIVWLVASRRSRPRESPVRW
jgi:hypothetical protein